MSLHSLSNLTHETSPVVRRNNTSLDQQNNNNGAQPDEFARCRAIIIDLDKEINAIEAGSLKKAKILKTVLIVAYIAIIALLIGLFFFSVATPLLPFWTTLVIPIPVMLLYAVINRFCSGKIVNTELRYKSLILYREYLRKYSSKLVSAVARYGKDLLSSEESGVLDKLRKNLTRVLSEKDQDIDKTDPRVKLELLFDLPSSSTPFVRRYQAETFAGAEDRLTKFWGSLCKRVKQAYNDFQSNPSQKSSEDWKKIAGDALVQDSEIDSIRFPVEDDLTDLATIKRFCAYSSAALHAVESSMEAFEGVFRGYAFLPSSELALNEVADFRNHVMAHAQTLSRYHQWITEVEEPEILDTKLSGGQALTVPRVFLNADEETQDSIIDEVSLNTGLHSQAQPISESDTVSSQSAIADAKQKARSKDRTAILQSFQAEYPIQETHALLARVGCFKNILNEKTWGHPERMLGMLRSKLEYAEKTLSDVNWGTSWMKAKEIVTRKQALKAQLEVLRHHVLESENRFRVFKDRAQAKLLLEDIANFHAIFEPGKETLPETDLHFLEKMKAAITSMESVFDNEGNLNAFEQWTDEYRIFCRDFLELSQAIDPFLGAVTTQEVSVLKKAYRILMESPEKAEAERKETLRNITALESSACSERSLKDLVTETTDFVGSLENMTGTLKDCLSDSVGDFAVKCQQLNNEYRGFDKQVIAALKSQLRQRAFNIDGPTLDPKTLSEAMDAEIEQALAEGIHLDNVSKRFLSGCVKQTSSIGRNFLSKQKEAIDRLIKAQEKSSKIMSGISLGVEIIFFISLLIVSLLASSIQLWWLPLLVIGVSLGLMAGTMGIDYLVKKKKHQITELELSLLMLRDTDDYVPPDVDTKDSKNLHRLGETLDLRGMSMVAGRNLLESIKKEPLTADKETTLVEAKKKIKRLKADVDKAVASASFKISPYVSVPIASNVPEFYSMEQKGMLAPIIQTIDDCERTINEIDKRLDAAIEEKLNLEESISCLNKTQTYIREFEEATPHRNKTLQRLMQTFSYLTWKVDFLSKALNLQVQNTQPDMNSVQASVERCITLSKKNPSDYENQMIEIFRDHERNNTVNYLIDCLELKAVKKLDDFRKSKAVKEPEYAVKASIEQQTREENHKRQTEDKKKLAVMGRIHLYGYLEYADNNHADLSELRTVLGQISGMEDENNSLKYKMLCIKALSLLEQTEESLSRLSEKSAFGLATITQRSEQLIAASAELRLFGNRVLRENRLSENAAAKRSLSIMKSFREQRHATCASTEESSYQRIMIGLEKYLRAIEQDASASSVEMEESIIHAMKELPSHVLKEEGLFVNATLADLKRKKANIQRKTTIFTQVKKEFYAQNLPKEKKLLGRKKLPQEIDKDIESERRKLIELQNLQRALLETKRKIADLNREMKEAESCRELALQTHLEVMAAINTEREED